MAAPNTTVWHLEPHTRAKHAILRRYLQAWTPILTQGGFREILYIDGFAGPGRYSKGEDGSPVIALNAARNHVASDRTNLRFAFVERDRERADSLKRIVEDLQLPENMHVKVYSGESFETAFGRIAGEHQSKNQSLLPTFAFIDPFGWKGVPFRIIQEIMSFPSCEVLVTFMYEEMNRFLGLSNQERNFDEFFGTQDWRQGIELSEPGKRNRFLHDLYLRQLKQAAGARYVRSFEMRNERDVVDYYLFHATNHIRGLARMKEAMWKVDESGEFSFSDATDPSQLVLFEKEPRFEILRNQILEMHFGGRVASVEEIEEFVLAETAFRETHYKRPNVSEPLELASLASIELNLLTLRRIENAEPMATGRSDSGFDPILPR